MANRARMHQDEQLIAGLCSEAMPALHADAKPSPTDDALLDEIVANSMAEWTQASTLTHAGWVGKAVTAGVSVLAGGALAWSLFGKGPTPEPNEPEGRPSVVQTASSTPEVQPEPAPAPAVEPSIEIVASPAPSSTSKQPKQPRLSAAEMLERANEARAALEFAEASRRYRALVDAYPRSREAAVSRVNAAKLELERLDNPKAARALYRDYLARTPDGNLGEEASWGLAKAHRALGDRSAERDELTRFLAEFEGSIRASSARARLEALGVSAP